MIVATTNDLPGHKVVKVLGIARGITVRSRSAVGSFAGGVQQLFGGRLSIYVELTVQAREEAMQFLERSAAEMGANAVLAMRFDANEITDGVTEVLAYGTAVVVEPIP